MRQPVDPDPLDGLRASLQWAVPIRSRELLHQYSQDELARILPAMAERGGKALGHYGDALQYANSPKKLIIPAWGDVVDGVAATALLAGPDGITVLGVRFCRDDTRVDHAAGDGQSAAPEPNTGDEPASTISDVPVGDYL